MRKVRIYVTQEDLDNGYGPGPYCPIELAALRQGIYLSVGTMKYRLHNNYSPSLPLPLRAIQFINNYDANVSVKPTWFSLEVPNDES